MPTADSTGATLPAPSDTEIRSRILRQAASIGLAVSPFALAFGILCAEADFRLIEAIGFSSIVFGGSSQFASALVLADGGTVTAAVVAGGLLALRSLAFGVVMAPALWGPFWWRAAVSQLMIDESLAVGALQTDLRWRRFGYLAGGIGVFVPWNLFTILGFTIFGGAGDLVTSLGIDATIPAAFLALLWPRLSDPKQRLIAGVGAVVAIVGAPLLPPGIPIVLAAAAVALLRPWRKQTSHLAGVS
ncbi:MAG: AzlC family ABC transporter permease [Acidimicrobiales bacterium]|nr:AzlC family ABC transporter permease [Acidimicrobiales bacterium]